MAAYDLRDKYEIFSTVDEQQVGQFTTKKSASELKQYYDAFG